MTNKLWYGDNLNILRAMPAETIDLIYLDPPYNSKRDYNVTFGSVAQSKAFTDTWSWGADDETNLDWLEEHHPGVGRLLVALGALLPKRGLYPYLVSMAVRLVEMHRLLKPTGSLYLHVDPTASHYLKLVMDQIFGGGNFRNEIIWDYQESGLGTVRKASMPSKHDVVLWYSKGQEYTYNPQLRDYKPEYKALFREDEQGLYREKWRCLPDGTKCKVKQRVAEGVPYTDVWQLPSLTGPHKERLGYPTQKPLALLERIVLMGSNEGDVVLDPYMGSGTTIEAAAKHGRKWIGIDLTPIAVATTKGRLDKAGIDVDNLDEWGSPKDLQSALHLYEQDKRAFDCWAVMRCSAMPADVGDRVVGLRRYMRFDTKGLHHCSALYGVSLDEPPSLNDVDRLKRLMKAKDAEMGFLICFDLPGAEVLEAVAAAGQVKLNGDTKKAPKMQVITVQDVIDQSYLATEVFSHERVQRQAVVNQMELV